MGKAPGYHARARLFSLCGCYTSKFLFSYLPYIVADKEIFLGILARKKDSDIRRFWIKDVFLEHLPKLALLRSGRKHIIYSINVKEVLRAAFRP